MPTLLSLCLVSCFEPANVGMPWHSDREPLDMWSMGCIMIEMLWHTHEVHFGRKDRDSTRPRHEHDRRMVLFTEEDVGEIRRLSSVFREIGTPSHTISDIVVRKNRTSRTQCW
jgi:hypothetical protein